MERFGFGMLGAQQVKCGEQCSGVESAASQKGAAPVARCEALRRIH